MTVGHNSRSHVLKFRLANWGKEQRSGSRGADHLLIHLTALCNNSHRCTLSDAGIAKLFDLKKRSVSRYLATLREKGLISVHFDGPKRSKRVITFRVPPEERQSGAPPAPNWHSKQRQNGGQNHYKFESEPGRSSPQERRPGPIIPHNATTEETLVLHRAFREREGLGGR